MKVLLILSGLITGGVIGFRVACMIIGILLDDPHNPD